MSKHLKTQWIIKMIKNDYQCNLNTLGNPFEINVRNKNYQTRLREFKLDSFGFVSPSAHRNIICMNSTYLELLDSCHDMRGGPIDPSQIIRQSFTLSFSSNSAQRLQD